MMTQARITDKQPQGLMMLFFTEMWERFSFYGMRAILTLYMTIRLFNDLQDPVKKSIAIGIYAAYGALVYATPFMGGIIADRFLGYKKSVLFGAFMMMIGQFILMIADAAFLYTGLAFLIVGNGFFKPNISSMVGALYADNDPRRDGGFTIFYMGINLGAFLAPLICGFVGEKYGWKYGFAMAGMGMLTGLLNFGLRDQILGNNGAIPATALHRKLFFMPIEYFIYLLSILSVVCFALLVKYYTLMTYVLTPFSLVVVVILLITAFRSEPKARDRLLVVLILLFFSTLFWAFFEQAGSSITLFTKEHVNRKFLGMIIPASVFQAVNPLFIVALAPVFSAMWLRLANIGREPSTPVKFAVGLLQLGLGFFAFSVAGFFAHIWIVDSAEGASIAMVPLFFLIAGYLLHTTGELCLSPIGLSMVTKLAPKSIVAMVMGAWFLSSAMAHHLAGGIAQLTAKNEMISLEQEIRKTVVSYLGVHEPASENSEGKESIALWAKQWSAVIEEKTSKMYSTEHINNLSYNDIIENVEKFNNQLIIDFLTNHYLSYDSLCVQCFSNVKNILLYNYETALNQALKAKVITASEKEQYSYNELLAFGKLAAYLTVFSSLGWIAIAAALILFCMIPLIKKMMHGIL